MLGPAVNIYRAPMNGRNFEYFGEDPLLASRIAVDYIRGVQSQGVSATIKHFVANNSEFDRHHTNAEIDERTMREIYLPPFEAAVKEAHVGAIMDAYDLTNGVHMTQNGYLNNEIAKKEWGFEGIIMSDWTATYDAVAAANGGLDLEMPSGLFMNRSNLLPAIRNGKVSITLIDDKVRRILRTAVRFGWLDRPQTDLTIPRFNQEGRQAALQTARESMVLLKNDGALLPLSKEKIKSLAIIGPNAYPAVAVGGGSAHVEPFSAVSYLEGLSNYLADALVYYTPGIPSFAEMARATQFFISSDKAKSGIRAEYYGKKDFGGKPSINLEEHINFGQDAHSSLPNKTFSVRWKGYFEPSETALYEVFIRASGGEDGFYRLYLDDRIAIDHWTAVKALVDSLQITLDRRPHKIVLERTSRSSNPLGGRFKLGIVPRARILLPEVKELASRADAVVAAVGFDHETESEGSDRTFQLPPAQDALIEQISSVNKNTIVVINSGGSVDMTSWIDRVPAIVEAWYPGQEGGTALAELLFGDRNFSGRTPITFERKWEENPVHDFYYPPAGSKNVLYREGVFTGYRGYEARNVTPLFPFGFGLSYTAFTYGNLSVKTYDRATSVSLDVTNSGKREGAEVIQVYIGALHAKLPRPAKELKAFTKVNLSPGMTKHIELTLDDRAFSHYDVSQNSWRVEPGEFAINVCHSSANCELETKITITKRR